MYLTTVEQIRRLKEERARLESRIEAYKEQVRSARERCKAIDEEINLLENTEMADALRTLGVSLAELPAFLQAIQSGSLPKPKAAEKEKK